MTTDRLRICAKCGEARPYSFFFAKSKICKECYFRRGQTSSHHRIAHKTKKAKYHEDPE